MAHIFSVCTPTPFVQFCKNYDLYELSNPYYSANIGFGPWNYSFTPHFGSGCKTISSLDQIVTTCPGVKTTVYPGVSSGDLDISALHCQLDLMQNILSGTQRIASESLKDLKIESPNMQSNTNEIKCKCCGCTWEKDYLKQTKFYICRMCSTQHIFSPYDVSDFAPFENEEHAKTLSSEIQKFQMEIYMNHSGYWRN